MSGIDQELTELKQGMDLLDKLTLIAVAIAAAYFVYTDYQTMEETRSGKELWIELRAKSGAHDELVSAYRNCRYEYFNNSVEQCFLRTNEYAKVRGYSDEEINNILGDIYNMSASISAIEH